MAKEPIRFIWTKTCSKCRRADELLKEMKIKVKSREYSKKPLTEDEIYDLVGTHSPLEFINTARPAYSELGFDSSPPTPEQAVAAMAENNSLLLRPILIRGTRMVKGFDEDSIRRLVREP